MDSETSRGASLNQNQRNTEECEPRYVRPIYHGQMDDQSDSDPPSADEAKKIETKRQANKLRKIRGMEKKRSKNLERVERMNVVNFLIYRCSFGKVHWAKRNEDEYRLMGEKLRLASDQEINTAKEMVEKKIQRSNSIVVSLKHTIKKFEEQQTDTVKLKCRLKDRESDVKRLNLYNGMIKKELDRRKSSEEV